MRAVDEIQVKYIHRLSDAKLLTILTDSFNGLFSVFLPLMLTANRLTKGCNNFVACTILNSY